MTDPQIDLSRPVQLAGRDFARHKYAYYERMRAESPVCRGRVAFIPLTLVTRHADCLDLLKDDRFVRNRTTATGGSRTPIPMPRSAALLTKSMITEDDPAHRRLRNLVNQAFTPRAVTRLEPRIREITSQTLDAFEREAQRQGGRADLLAHFASPIPVAAIAQLVGVPEQAMPRFRTAVGILTQGFSSWKLLKTLFFDLRSVVAFVRELVDAKRAEPGDDLLTGLLEAEEQGQRLDEDEIVSMVFLLVVAGFETTAHLIANGVRVLLEHRDAWEHLRAHPDALPTAIEEILRFCGPIHGTKLGYAREDLELHGVPVRRGGAVVPLLGCANRDDSVFEAADRFDIARRPNPHLGFSHGNHFCLGAQLARIETRIALEQLIARFPRLALAPEAAEIEPQRTVLWHRFPQTPVLLDER